MKNGQDGVSGRHVLEVAVVENKSVGGSVQVEVFVMADHGYAFQKSLLLYTWK